MRNLPDTLTHASRAAPAFAAATALLLGAIAARADDVAAGAGASTPTPAQPRAGQDKAPERPLRVTLSSVGYTDKSGIYLVEPKLVGAIPAPLQAELRVGASFTDAGLQLAAPATTTGGAAGGRRATGSTIATGAPGRSMVGFALSVPWSVARATLDYARYWDDQTGIQDVGAAVAVKPLGGVELSGGLRHRPFVEMAEPLAADMQAFYTAGPAGAQQLLAAWPLAADEVRLGANLSPVSWGYAYGDWRRMSISDGNRGWNLSAGAGVSLATLLRLRSPVDVTPRWDTWAAAYAASSLAYYSPARVVSHSPGVEVRLRQSAFEVAAEGGVTFAPGQSFTGTFWGGSAVLRLGRVSLAARAQARSDPWFASRKAWAALQTEW